MALSKTFPQEHILSAADVNEHLANHVPNEGDAYDTGWMDIPLINGWEYASEGVRTQYRRVGMQVFLRGRAVGGSGVVAELPEPFWPTQAHQWSGREGSTANTVALFLNVFGQIIPGDAVAPNLNTTYMLG